MDALITTVHNTTVYPTNGVTLLQTTPVIGMCRNRGGYINSTIYNTLTCALCFTYVYRDHNITVDHSTQELVVGKNHVYGEGTRMKVDLDNANAVSFVCRSLHQPSECWKWQDCCQQARACCQTQNNNSLTLSEANDSKICPQTWDGYACWPETPPGQRRQMVCPNHVPGAVSGRYAYKSCTSDSTWFAHPFTNKEWTDYTDCTRNEHFRRLSRVGIVCNSITIVLLVPACFIFLCYKPLRQQHRIRLHLSLMVSSFTTSVCLLIWEIVLFKNKLESKTKTDITLTFSIGCRLLLMIIRYSEVSSFMWMFIEGFHLHRLLVRTFSVPKSYMGYYLFGFGFPLLPVIAYALARVHIPELKQTGCWIERAGAYEWLIAAPSLTALTVNIFFLLRIIFIIVKQLEPHPNEPSNFRRAVKAVVLLAPIFGVQFLVFVYRPEPTSQFSQVYEMLEKMCSSLQGSFVVLVFCYFNKEVQGHLKTSFVPLLWKRGAQDLNSRAYTMTTHFVPESDRLQMANGRKESGPMIPLRPISQHCYSDTKRVDDISINGDLHAIPENENLLLHSIKFS